MGIADGVMWPLATCPDRARWAAQAAEMYVHMALLVMRATCPSPAVEPAFPEATLDLAQRLYKAIEARLEELGAPPRRRVLCERCGARLYTPFPLEEAQEAWPAFCDTCAIVGLVTADGRWTNEVRLFDLSATERSA